MSPRTARNYRRDPRRGGKPRKEWVEFCRAEGRSVDGSPPLAPVEVATSPLQRARAAEETAWKTLSRLQGMVSACDAADQLPALSAAVRNARKAWEEARIDRETLEKSAGELLPRSVLGNISRLMVPRLRSAWQNHCTNVASRLAPEVRPAFFNAWRDSAAAWDDAIRALDSDLEQYANA